MATQRAAKEVAAEEVSALLKYLGEGGSRMALRAGYVEKQAVDSRAIDRRWKTRWLELHPHALVWFKSQGEAPKGYLLLSGTSGVQEIATRRGERIIEVKSTSGRSLLFRGMTSIEQSQWKDTISGALTTMHSSGAAPTTLSALGKLESPASRTHSFSSTTSGAESDWNTVIGRPSSFQHESSALAAVAMYSKAPASPNSVRGRSSSRPALVPRLDEEVDSNALAYLQDSDNEDLRPRTRTESSPSIWKPPPPPGRPPSGSAMHSSAPNWLPSTWSGSQIFPSPSSPTRLREMSTPQMTRPAGCAKEAPGAQPKPSPIAAWKAKQETRRDLGPQAQLQVDVPPTAACPAKICFPPPPPLKSARSAPAIEDERATPACEPHTTRTYSSVPAHRPTASSSMDHQVSAATKALRTTSFRSLEPVDVSSSCSSPAEQSITRAGRGATRTARALTESMRPTPFGAVATSTTSDVMRRETNKSTTISVSAERDLVRQAAQHRLLQQHQQQNVSEARLPIQMQEPWSPTSWGDRWAGKLEGKDGLAEQVSSSGMMRSVDSPPGTMREAHSQSPTRRPSLDERLKMKQKAQQALRDRSSSVATSTAPRASAMPEEKRTSLNRRVSFQEGTLTPTRASCGGTLKTLTNGQTHTGLTDYVGLLQTVKNDDSLSDTSSVRSLSPTDYYL